MNRCLSLLESLNQRSRTGSPAHRKASFEWGSTINIPRTLA